MIVHFGMAEATGFKKLWCLCQLQLHDSHTIFHKKIYKLIEQLIARGQTLTQTGR
jgi:hypothetical protein